MRGIAPSRVARGRPQLGSGFSTGQTRGAALPIRQVAAACRLPLLLAGRSTHEGQAASPSHVPVFVLAQLRLHAALVCSLQRNRLGIQSSYMLLICNASACVEA